MRLDYSCIRNILLTVEKYETLHNSVPFSTNEQDFYSDYLSEYSVEQIVYHVQYCIKSHLLFDDCPTKVWGKLYFDCRLEPSGHDFLANIRTSEKWNHTQNILSKIGGASLKVISAVSEGVTTALADKYLPAEIKELIS